MVAAQLLDADTADAVIRLAEDGELDALRTAEFDRAELVAAIELASTATVWARAGRRDLTAEPPNG